ncbi:hypothetical protein F4802DRAFT_546734, partial [Xylaria palmicola]
LKPVKIGYFFLSYFPLLKCVSSTRNMKSTAEPETPIFLIHAKMNGDRADACTIRCVTSVDVGRQAISAEGGKGGSRALGQCRAAGWSTRTHTPEPRIRTVWMLMEMGRLPKLTLNYSSYSR